MNNCSILNVSGSKVDSMWGRSVVEAYAASHMSERPQEVRAHARGRAYRKALCCRSLPGKNYC